MTQDEEIVDMKRAIFAQDRLIYELCETIEVMEQEIEMGYESEKGKSEWEGLKPHLKASWGKRRWWHPVDLGHFAVDFFVEGCRHAAYLFGHVFFWLVVADLVVLVSWLLTL